MGSDEDPEDGKAVALSIFIAVGVYGVSQGVHVIQTGPSADYNQFFLVFCGLQAWLHIRASRKGAISLR